MKDVVDQIERPTLHDALVDRLRVMIIEAALAPGSKVNEQALCERFSVSRTPLREALRSLAVEGLVVITPRRGATIAPVTRADLEEAFPVVGALEALAGELACANVSDADIARAKELQAQLVSEHQAGDLHGYSTTNAAIHRLIVDAAANPTLKRLLRTVDGRVRRARYLANMSEIRWAAAVAEHEEILSALVARDGARLGAILRRHIANKLAALCEQLDL